jgi:hypothetical protein
VNVSNFHSGIKVGAWNSTYSGFRGARITNVNAFNNVQSGIDTYGYYVDNYTGSQYTQRRRPRRREGNSRSSTTQS